MTFTAFIEPARRVDGVVSLAVVAQAGPSGLGWR
jgi:hypothetical protein